MQISSFMRDDHQRCDHLFASAEEQVNKGDWEQAARSYKRFHDAMEQHFTMEEETLFPRFEEVTGMSRGPTEMMRSEHIQMRQLFAQMQAAVDARSADDFLGASDTLLILMQQHNAKEGQILYPMTDNVLEGEAEELIETMQGTGQGVEQNATN